MSKVIANIDAILEQAREAITEKLDVQATVIETLQLEIERLQGLLDSTENLQHLIAYESHAMSAGLSLHDWVRQKLQEAVRYKTIPVSESVYKKICSLAGGRSTSIMRLTQSKSMDLVIINAIDNQKIREDT
ncbi:hypothetical protein J5I95_22625 [Candidatus Poribacteria bacterium]|nr:hypothetical protein [Candidatus Poribacteria bacterium]